MTLQNKSRDLLSGSLVKNMLMYTIPVILSGVLQLFFNAADLIVVGKFDIENGSLAQAAIGSTGAMINLILGIFIGISVGVNVVIARLVGSKNGDMLRTAVQTSMLLGLIAGVVIAIAGFIFAKPLLVLIGTDDAVMPFAEEYLRIYFIGAPFSMIYNFGSAIMRAYGDTKRPMIFLGVSGVINVILNLITVIIFDMSVTGVAIATSSSNLFACIFIVVALIRTDAPIKLHLKGMKISGNWTKQIVALGLPAGIQGSLFSISNVVIQSAVNSFGDPHITAGNGNAGNFEGFIYLAMNAFYQTTITFTGQSYGAKRYDLMKKIYYIGLMLVAATGIVLGYISFFLREPIMAIYSSNAEDIAAGVARLTIVCVTYFFCGLMDVSTGAIRGMGNSIVPMIISLIGACGFRIVWIYTIFVEWKTPYCLYISYPVTWILTFLALYIYAVYYRRKIVKSDMKLQLEQINAEIENNA